MSGVDGHGGAGLLTEKEVATLWRVCPEMVARYRKTGKLRYVRVGKRGVRYRLEDVEAFLEEQAVKHGEHRE